jgi:hypothetical protein
MGGREYEALDEMTVENDDWYMDQVEQSGLRGFMVEPGETPRQTAERVISKAIFSGRARFLLAGLIVPVENGKAVAWTPEVAATTERHLAGITNDEDKQIMRNEMMSAIIGSFDSGLAFFKTSTPSSPPADEPE